MPFMDRTEHEYNTLEDAKKMQQTIKTKYGYTPRILIFKPKYSLMGLGKKIKYVVVEPKGMTDIKK